MIRPLVYLALGLATAAAMRPTELSDTRQERTCFDKKTPADCPDPFCCWNPSQEECMPKIDDTACGCRCQTFEGIIACLDDRNRYCENIVSLGDADNVEECCEFCSLSPARVDYYVWYSISQTCFCLQTVGRGRLVLHENKLHTSGFMTDNCKLGTQCLADVVHEEVCVDEDLFRVV